MFNLESNTRTTQYAYESPINLRLLLDFHAAVISLCNNHICTKFAVLNLKILDLGRGAPRLCYYQVTICTSLYLLFLSVVHIIKIHNVYALCTTMPIRILVHSCIKQCFRYSKALCHIL